MVEFLVGYWWLIIIAIAVLVVAINLVKIFLTMPSSQRVKKVKEWLLYAVAEAEKALGSGTGQMKLRYVYDKFLIKFPFMAMLISFETFSKLVDEALKKFNTLLDENEEVKKYIEK
jgi:hypothetical protein